MAGPICVEAEEVSLIKREKRGEPQLQKLTVVLDMDECILHSKFHGLEAHSNQFRQHEMRPEKVSDLNSFWFPLDGVFVQVNLRPGLQEFLEKLATFCDIVVYTAAMPDYAAPVLNYIDPTGAFFSRRLYRTSCKCIRGMYLKDLSMLGQVFSSNPGRCVLIDNNPCSFLLQPANGILVTSFYDDAEDSALASALQLLQHLNFVPDVRPVLYNMFQLEYILNEYRALLFPSGLSDEYPETGLSMSCKASASMDIVMDDAETMPMDFEV